MKKSLLKIGLIFTVFLMMCPLIVQAAISNEYIFGITNQRVEDGKTYIYSFLPADKQSKHEYIWNVQRKNGSIAVTDEVYYCLAHRYGDFGSFNAEVPQTPLPTGGYSVSLYSGAYNLKENGVINTINSVYNGTAGNTLTGTKYNSLLWLFDHMFINGEDNKDTFLKNIPWDSSANLTPYPNVYDGMNATDTTEDDISVSDIEVIQQLAIWHFTNPDSVQGFPIINISVNGGLRGAYSTIFSSAIGSTTAGSRRETLLRMVYKYFVDGGTNAANTLYTGDNITTALVYINNAAQPVVRLTRERELSGEYKVIVKKVDMNGTSLSNAKFTIDGTEKTTNSSGIVETDTKTISASNVNTTDIIVIKETEAPTGYKKYEGTITLAVTKKVAANGLSYVIDTANLDDISKASSDVNIDYNTNTITITVKDEKITGTYNVKINKRNQKGEPLPGAQFTINGQNYTTDNSGYITLINNKELTAENIGTETFNLTEIKAPTGYVLYDGTVTLQVTTGEQDGSYKITNKTLTESVPSGKATVELDEATNTVTVIIVEDNIDLSLRKFISKVTNKSNVEVYTSSQLANRVPNVNTEKLVQKTDTTAVYNHNKNALQVNIGDLVTYTFRIYNEGETDAYITEITDYLPKYLKPIDNGEWYISYGVDEDKFETKLKSSAITTITGASDNLSGLVGNTISDGILLPAFNGTKLSYIDMQVVCEVLEPEVENDRVADYKITNIAEITGMKDKNNNVINNDIDSRKDNIVLPESEENWEKYKDDELNKQYIPGQQDDDDFEKIKIVIPKNDLSLRKFITKVNEKEYNRAPQVDTTSLKQGIAQKGYGTATYNHTKEPVLVTVGDIVTYTIRVYNEGNTNAYVSEITDHLPEYLEFLENDELNKKYNWMTRGNSRTIYTNITSKFASDENGLYTSRENGKMLTAFDGEESLNYIDVQVRCKVSENITEAIIQTNIADITGITDINNNPIEDIDSQPNNVVVPEDKDLPSYKDDEKDKPYIPGQQDDDDFEKIYVTVPQYDLSLRKFITKVNEKEYDRAPQVDTTSLKQGITQKGYGTATYNHTKEPLLVKKGDIVTYTLRVYNEGNINAYVSEITDYLPEYLEFLEDDEFNKKYNWKTKENGRIIYTDITSKSAEDIAELYKDRQNGKLLLAFDGGDTLDYIDVQVRCKVSKNAESFVKQTNIAEITEITDENEQPIKDADSQPDNVVVPEDKDLPNYKDDEKDKPYIPGQQDDDDFEKILVNGDFDLALRKFITKVNSVDINNRYPELSFDDNGKIKYTHTKTPVEVCYQDTVIYTIRVYNEGEIDGYANEVTDDVPDGLEFIMDHEINKEYRWKLLDENQEETTDVSKAKYIVTDYLSEEQNSDERNNLIKAFNKNEGLTETNPDHRDLKIAFKVTYKVTDPKEESRILVNVAQISQDSDDDIDSVPHRDEEYDDNDHEDDIDYEQVKVKYFDLSLLKWVTKVMVTENGKTTTTNTGHTGEENPEPVVKVEIKTKKVNSIIVKFAYTIKVKNEGEIGGYVKEITDYIPNGLRFAEADNPDWYVRADGKVATKKLENTYLEPGETAEVEIILTWINGEKNLGTKINVAEISDDDNPSKTPDIDSTPDNEKPGEDDIDDAPVMLVIKTGAEVNPQYIILSGIVLSILASGVILIKKFVF